MQRRLRFFAATILAMTVAAMPLRAQLVEGEFATPEDELAAWLTEAIPEPTVDLQTNVKAYAPHTIIPETPRAEGEWVHYNGRETGGSSPAFDWGYVTWRLSGVGIGAAIVATFAIPDWNLAGTVTITRIDPAIVDAIRITVVFDDPDTVPDGIAPQLHISSRLAINFTPVSGTLDPVGRLVVGLPEALSFFTSEAVGFQTLPPLEGGTYASIMLSLGETGRAVFDEAMAAWGIAPTE